jgi:P4 family phage/plasmid primase-like protien
MNQNDVITEAAYGYLSLDLPIIPLCSCDHRGMSERHKQRCKAPGKSPILKQWTKHKATTEEHLTDWFSSTPNSNLGLVLGQTENWNIVGVDIDGEKGEQTFQEMCKGMAVPDTWSYVTGGGRRLLYQLPDGLVTKKNKISCGPGHEEVAFIATGQQTVIPPSIHPSGKLYQWEDGCSPFDCDMAMAPKWIEDIIRADNRKSGDNPFKDVEDIPQTFNLNEQSPPVTEDDFNKKVSEGGRSDHLAKLVGSWCANKKNTKADVYSKAMETNVNNFTPPLPEGEVQAMVDSIYESEQLKREEKAKKRQERQEMSINALAELFLKDQFEQGIHWRYYAERDKFYKTSLDQAPWNLQTDAQVDLAAELFLKSVDPQLADSRHRTELRKSFGLLLMQMFGDGGEFNVGKNPNTQYIAVGNGLLDWKTGELRNWDPKFNHTYNIQANFDAQAKTSEAMQVWNEALHSWLPDEKTIMFLQEYIGYALLPDCKMRTAVFLEGGGSNGKSLFIDCVKKLFDGSVVIAQPHSLADKFGTTCLLDKMLIVCSDVDSAYLNQTGVLKQIIAGDDIRGEFKGGSIFDFTPIGKMLFSANKLPKSSDKTHGWYSRLQLVKFPHEFEVDQTYYDTITSTFNSKEGRSALLFWAVEGLQRLRSQGKFTISRDMMDSMNQYTAFNTNEVL